MVWVNVPGLAGKVYVPEDAGQSGKKHACTGCFACQWCDENRCRVCRCGALPADASATRDGAKCRRSGRA